MVLHLELMIKSSGTNSSGSEIRDFSSFVRNKGFFDFPLLVGTLPGVNLMGVP